MITKKQLQSMSDFEVNKFLAELLGKKVEQHSIFNVGLQWCFVDGEGNLYRMSNYCNTPNDIIPLAFEHRVHVGPDKDIWYAIHDASITSEILIEVEGANPLRAIACCLILVLQEKQK